ncbi:uncharacterized protein C4orf17 homolog isoform X2 [Monodelphis domestica]|uniref:uncharacterized protein C4orf17 homolog isoform X2 n=1 Tax=Monodelphis domestica TaxID=13616 RepID=UPI0004431492|nr:uncharacterized protein C4orf17 homolog isoform X2 [Monodelphis domestica]
MNINFKSQPDPLTGHDVSRNANCFLVRHTPHPRRVCHIKGLNDIPICAVNDENIFKALCDVDHLTAPDKDIPPLSKIIYANNARSFHNPAPNKTKMPPRPNSEPCKNTNEFSSDPCDSGLKIKKEELRDRPQVSGLKASQLPMLLSSELTNPKNDMRGKTVCIPNYLDQEIKILSKLCEILQTDSLAELLTWLLHASVKEKEWVSALIHSELSEINLLKDRDLLHQKSLGKEKEKPHPTVKPGSAASAKSKTPASVKEEISKVNRVSSFIKEKNKEPKQAENKPGLTKERSTLEEAISEYFSKTKSPTKNLKIWERTCCPRPARARSQQQGSRLSSPKSTNSPPLKF